MRRPWVKRLLRLAKQRERGKLSIATQNDLLLEYINALNTEGRTDVIRVLNSAWLNKYLAVKVANDVTELEGPRNMALLDLLNAPMEEIAGAFAGGRSTAGSTRVVSKDSAASGGFIRGGVGEDDGAGAGQEAWRGRGRRVSNLGQMDDDFDFLGSQISRLEQLERGAGAGSGGGRNSGEELGLAGGGHLGRGSGGRGGGPRGTSGGNRDRDHHVPGPRFTSTIRRTDTELTEAPDIAPEDFVKMTSFNKRMGSIDDLPGGFSGGQIVEDGAQDATRSLPSRQRSVQFSDTGNNSPNNSLHKAKAPERTTSLTLAELNAVRDQVAANEMLLQKKKEARQNSSVKRAVAAMQGSSPVSSGNKSAGGRVRGALGRLEMSIGGETDANRGSPDNKMDTDVFPKNKVPTRSGTESDPLSSVLQTIRPSVAPRAVDSERLAAELLGTSTEGEHQQEDVEAGSPVSEEEEGRRARPPRIIEGSHERSPSSHEGSHETRPPREEKSPNSRPENPKTNAGAPPSDVTSSADGGALGLGDTTSNDNAFGGGGGPLSPESSLGPSPSKSMPPLSKSGTSLSPSKSGPILSKSETASPSPSMAPRVPDLSSSAEARRSSFNKRRSITLPAVDKLKEKVESLQEKTRESRVEQQDNVKHRGGVFSALSALGVNVKDIVMGAEMLGAKKLRVMVMVYGEAGWDEVGSWSTGLRGGGLGQVGGSWSTGGGGSWSGQVYGTGRSWSTG